MDHCQQDASQFTLGAMLDVDPQAEADWLLRDLPGAPGARAIVRHHMGRESIVVVAHAVLPAKLTDHDGQALVMVRGRLLPEIERWYLLHELGEWRIKQLDYRGADTEQVADAIAACLVLPRDAYASELRSYGRRFGRLARAFLTTETAAARRLGEVTGEPVVVIAPSSIYVSGDAYGWPGETELRGLAKARRLPPGVKRVALGDDKRRRVLLAK